MAQQHCPDLVLLDLMLPGVDGVEVCRQLRKYPRTASIGIASSRLHPFASSTEAAAVAAELRRCAKAMPGWIWRVDRRRV